MRSCPYSKPIPNGEMGNCVSVEKKMLCKILENCELGLGAPDTCPYTGEDNVQNCELRNSGLNASEIEIEDFINKHTTT